jgi:hypothetical protein
VAEDFHAADDCGLLRRRRDADGFPDVPLSQFLLSTDMIPPQQCPFLRVLSFFAANPWKLLTMNHLHAKLGFSNQAQSSLIRLN